MLKEYTGEGSPLGEYRLAEGKVLARKMFGYKGRRDQDREGTLHTRGGQLYYTHDALGNVTALADHLGEELVKYRYDAFGGLFTGISAPYNTLGLTSKSYDPKAGLIDFSARWYDPAAGRFTTADPWRGRLEMPQTLNRYAYVVNNPLRYTDPTGMWLVDVYGPDGYEVGELFNNLTHIKRNGAWVWVRAEYPGPRYQIKWTDYQPRTSDYAGRVDITDTSPPPQKTPEQEAAEKDRELAKYQKPEDFSVSQAAGILDETDRSELGRLAHLDIQRLFLRENPGSAIEVPNPINFKERADMVLFKMPPQKPEIYEIKPVSYSPYGSLIYNAQGKAQLERYIQGFSGVPGTTWNPNGRIVPASWDPNIEIALYTFPQDPGMIYYNLQKKRHSQEKQAVDNVLEKAIKPIGYAVLGAIAGIR